MAAPSSSANPIAKSKDVSSELMDSTEVKGKFVEETIDIMNSKEHIEKFERYEAEFKQYLMSKYFSDKTIFGGNISDVKVNFDGETISASRLPPYQSYLDPVAFMEMISKGSSFSTETQRPSTSKRKRRSK